MKTNTKIIAASLSLLASFEASAGIGGVNVQSNLGEPFSGSIVVTGAEAQAALSSGASVSGSGVHGTVVPHGNGNALIRLHSSSVVTDPIITFTVRAGSQTRQYVAMINPSNYRPAKQAQSNRAPKAGPLRPQRVPRAETPVSSPEEREIQPVERETRMRTVNPRYHRVQPGDSLASIAARYRPRGMSVQRAVRALVAANPRAFRNGKASGMYRNVTLYIPTAAQFHAYAKTAQPKQSHPRISRGAAMVGPLTENGSTNNAPQNQAGVQTQPENPPAPPKPEPQPQTPPPAPENKQPEPKTVAPEPQPVQPQATQPQPASSVPQPAAPSVPVAQPETPVQPVENVASSASVPAVSAPVEQPELQPKPQMPTPPQPQPAAEEPVAEDETDWLMLGGAGAAAVAVLGGAAYALSRRRKNKGSALSDDDDADDGISFEQADDNDTWDLPADKTSETKTTPASNNFVAEDDFFDVPAEPKAAANDFATAEPVQTIHNANNTTFDDDDDWDMPIADKAEDEWEIRDKDDSAITADGDDWLSGDSFIAEEAPVGQPETADDYAVEDVFSVMPEETPAAAPVAEAETAVPAADGFMAFDEPVAEPAVAPAVDDIAFDLDAPAPESKPTAETQPENTFAAPDIDFDANHFAAPETVEEPQEISAAPSVDFDLDLPHTEESVSVPDVPEVAENALDFNAPFVEEPAFNVETQPETPVVEPSTDFSLDFDLAPATETPQPETALAFEPAESAPAADPFADLSFDEPAAQPEPEPVSAARSEPATQPAVSLSDFVVEEEPPQHPPINEAGIVSGALGLAEPQEAKLELAKMYLEIDDAVAARETLRELISESSGSIQAQAKQLLDELGG